MKNLTDMNKGHVHRLTNSARTRKERQGLIILCLELLKVLPSNNICKENYRIKSIRSVKNNRDVSQL